MFGSYRDGHGLCGHGWTWFITDMGDVGLYAPSIAR